MKRSSILKPEYRVPSMREITELPHNGKSVVSTFSGAGGSCLGYRMAGFKVIWANEFVPAACDTYRLNHPNSILDTRDIRTIEPSEILDAVGLKKGEIDILDGSPPCASFSTAGKREKTWGKVKKYSDTSQRVDDLFFEFTRLLNGLQPKVFVAENVSGLVKGTAKGFFLEILKALKACGYNVKAKLLDAQWLGVPQSRQRIIFIGVRNDLKLEPTHPTPLKYRYSVDDALPWIRSVSTLLSGKTPGMRDASLPCPTVTTGDTGGNGRHVVEAVTIRQGNKNGHSSMRGEIVDRGAPSPTIIAGGGAGQFVVESESDISKFAIGKEWDTLTEGEQSDKYFSLVKVDRRDSCPTITAEGGNASLASVTHPIERRKFSIAELKRICAFPDDFQLTGSYAQQWERLGRSVPPVMMFHIAKTIEQEILCKI
jgi:DNA (cytosine-5)-methyltransferase 1